MTMPDRRRYFRINDWVGLHYRVLGSTEEAPEESPGDNVQISAAQIFSSIDKEFIQSLNSLWQNNPAAANTLSLLNRKIELLAAELNLDSALPEGTDHQSVNVNISACGIAFECNDRFRTGEMLELFLTLRPENNQIKVTGQVVACERSDGSSDNAYVLRVDFQRVPIDVQEQLIQHIVKRQSGQLAQQRKQE